jgi:4-hydroxythreonine-4-phosphate dehydrogenase
VIGPLALTMGEPAGIGGEIGLRAWAARQSAQTPAFFVLDDPARLQELSGQLGLKAPISTIDRPEAAAAVFPTALPVLPLPFRVRTKPGQPDPANVPAVIAAIDQAIELALSNRIAGIVTNPIQKAALYAGGFPCPGHTEYLAQKTASPEWAMLLTASGQWGDFRVVLTTVHLALGQAVAALSGAAIVKTARLAHQALMRDFAIAKPRLVVAALNPHGGEGGALGREEIDIIAPAVQTLAAEGMDIRGPLPADTLFHPDARKNYDAAICLYHDQALIPLKTIDFYGGVNVTLGLPIVRTSPDHGTAFDIAGRGLARPDSLIAALKLAAGIAENRARVKTA